MRAIIALLAMIFVTQAAVAQPVVTIPETVVTATRLPLPVTDIPAGVTVITRQDIEASGATTLGDVLTTVPGLHVSPSGGPGGQSSVFMRGTNSGHVLVLRDGMPINDASNPSDAFNFGTDTLSDIERIEVIRGPMAALYGSGAIGGVINLISRRGAAGAPMLEADLSGGYPATIQGSALASGVTGPFDYAVTAESQSQRGFDSVPQRMSNYTGIAEGFRDRIATANLGYTPVEGTRLSLFLRGSETLFGFNNMNFELNDPTFASIPRFDDSNTSGKVDSLLGRIGVTSKLFGGTYETGLFLGREQDDRRYFEPLKASDPSLQTDDERYHSYRTDLQWNNTVHLNDLMPSSVLTASDLTFGYERTTDTIDTRVNQADAGVSFTSSARASMTTDAVYTGITTTIWRRLILTGQVRQDWVGANAPTTWRVGSVVLVPEIDTSFKAAYGTAFRVPSLYERFGTDSFGTVGNPTLLPERSEGWEFGFTSTIPVLGRADAVTAGATYFNQQIYNLIEGVLLPTGISSWANVSAAHIQGVELEFAVHPAPWLSLHASYSFTDTTSDDPYLPPGAPLLRRPKNAGEMDATILPLPGLRIVPVLIYTGPSFDVLYGNQDNSLGYGYGQHGLVANLTVAYDVTPKVQLHLDGTNIFNSRFEPVNGYQMPGAAAIAGVRVRW
jgi:vitamin B12 transporter